MKVRVIKPFRDKKTKDLKEIGEIIDITEKRYEEINNAGYGMLVTKDLDTPNKEPTVMEMTMKEEPEQRLFGN